MATPDLTDCLPLLRYVAALLNDPTGTCRPRGMTPPYPTPAWVAGVALTPPSRRAAYLRAELRVNPDVRAALGKKVA